MADNFDYMFDGLETQDKKVLSNLSKLGLQLKKLQEDMEKKEKEFERAKKAFQHFANVVVPQQMYAAGVDSVSLSGGGTLRIKYSYYCQPNKNEADQKVIAEWLKAHKGEHLIEHKAAVSPDDISLLKENDIPYIESSSVNTIRLKAFLKDGIGVTTGQQQFTLDEIPKCIHFQVIPTVEITQ